MKRYFKLVLFILLFSSPVYAGDIIYLNPEITKAQNNYMQDTQITDNIQQEEVEENNLTPASQKAYVRTSVPSEVRLVCTVDKSTKQQDNATGSVYTFILRGNQVYDVENKLIKTSEVKEGVLKFTYRFKQNFTYETTRFTIDRYTGAFKAYRKFYDLFGGVNELDTGVCTVNNNTSRLF